jgi:hypothetical protein
LQRMISRAKRVYVANLVMVLEEDDIGGGVVVQESDVEDEVEMGEWTMM